MANDDDGGLPAGGGNRSLEELRISHLMQRLKTGNHKRLYSRSQKFSAHLHWEPRFAAQPRYLHHLQPPSPSFSSHHHLHTVDHIHTKPMTSLLCNKPITKYISNPPHPSPSTHSRTHSHIPNQFQSHHTRETHKTPNPKFDNTHENQFKTTETCSRFSPETHPPSQFRDQQNAINPICETQSIETHLQPQNSASTHDPCKKNQISQRRVLVDLDLHSSKEDYKSVAPLDSKNRQQHFDLSNSENKLQTKAIMNENGGGCNSQLQFSAAASRVCEVNTSKQNNILVCDFTDTISRCSAPNYSVISQMGQTHENLVGTNSNSKPSVPRIKVTEIEGEDEPLSPVKLVVSSDSGELIGVENGGLSDSEVTVLVKDSTNEDDCNAVAVTQGVQFESSVGAKENVFEVVDDTVEEKLVISCVVMVKAIDLGVVIKAHIGFSEFKIKLERRRQWQIAWAFSACRWTIVLVPLWVWDALRRDFSVGVYHSHKPNMGLAPLSFN